MKTVLITGATSGIGLATAEILAKKDFKLILCGRRKDKLIELENSLSKYTPVLIRDFDVRNRGSVFTELQNLPKEFQDIDVLINNAGNAHGLDKIQDGDPDDWELMMDINVKGLLFVTKAILPAMIKKGNGHIINIGSIAGIDVYEKGNVYCATKSAVDALSKGMRIDLNESGIKVSEVKPGAVNTEFSSVRFKGDQGKADKVYEGFEPLVADDIAEIIYFVISRPSHVNIADLLVLPVAQASSSKIFRK